MIFYIVINVNHPYFNEIRFQLNSDSVDNDAETLLDGPNGMDYLAAASGENSRHERRFSYLQCRGCAFQCGISPI